MNSTKQKQNSIENKIGLFWLHKLGIVSLVFGFVFLITYSFQYFDPILKLLSGLAVAASLLFLGEKMSHKEQQKWFAQGLTAGGWSLAYFCAYAAHYIPSVKVITSLPVETCLLTLVAAGSLYSALRARSELMAIYSVTLAAVTILINGPGLFSDISFLIIAITASVLGNLQSWRKLFAFAMAACYLGHAVCSYGSLNVLSENHILTGFLYAIWLTFTIGIGFTMRVPEGARNFVTTLACANAIAFSFCLAFFRDANPAGFLHEILYVVPGIVYLGTAKWLLSRNQEQLSTVHSLLGLFLVNVAKAMHYSGLDLLAVDVLQIALLGIVGMKYKIRAFLWAAAFLSCAFIPAWYIGLSMHAPDPQFGFHCFEYAKTGFLAASVFALLAWQHHQHGKGFYPYFYGTMCNVMLAFVCLNIDEASWLAVALALMTVANYAAAIKLKDEYYTFCAILPFVCSAVVVGVSFQSWISAAISLWVIVMYFGYALGHTATEVENKELHEQLKWFFAYAATLVLTGLLLQKLPDDFVSLGLGVEGIVLLLCGFIIRESFFRLSGLGVLGILTGKLLFVDLANHNTIERILSFIAAGVVFLLSSYAYGRFTHSFDEQIAEEDDVQKPIAAIAETVSIDSETLMIVEENPCFETNP